MNENSNVVRLRHPDEIDDPLTNILRSGARQLLAQAIELEAEAFLAEMKDFRLADGRDRVVRHGHGPERTIQTGIGAVEVARVKFGIAGLPATASGSGSPRQFCRCGHGARRAWMRFCRFFICVVSRPGTSRRPWRRCWARMRRTCRRR